MDLGAVLQQAAGATADGGTAVLITKTGVDFIKRLWGGGRNADTPPILPYVAGPCLAGAGLAVVAISQGHDLSSAPVIGGIIGGIFPTFAMAKVVNDVHNEARPAADSVAPVVADPGVDEAQAAPPLLVPEVPVADPPSVPEQAVDEEVAAPTQQATLPALLSAIDVSSAQPANFTSILDQFQPDHVIVKLYQRVEHIYPGGNFRQAQAHSAAQLELARSLTCTVEGYIWLYATVDPRQAVQDGVQLARDCGIDFDAPMQIANGAEWRKPILWIDVETYYDSTGITIPDASVIRAALDECTNLGVEGGIYSSRSMFQRIGNPSFEGVPIWVADYNGRDDLDVPPFGQGAVVGHQWTSDPVDRSVFATS